MKNTEQVKRPEGYISMVLHKGGEYNTNTGKIEGGEILQETAGKNLIVNMASELMASRMAPGSHTGASASGSIVGEFLEKGLQYLSVGVGILQDTTVPYDPVTNPVNTTLWNLQSPPAETLTTVKLQGEIFRKEFTSWTFIDASGAAVATPTNILQLVTTFMEAEAVGPLTEMGLFGGNAEPWNNGLGQNSGYMFNCKNFPVWNKPSDSRLTITWNLTF